MSEEPSRHDIRRLLKTFGIEADEAMTAHLQRLPAHQGLRVRLILEDLTSYEAEPPAEPLHVVMEGEIRRA